MANKVIKGLTVEIGGDTTKLGKALENVEQKSRSLSGELGSINKLLRLDPSNVELLAQKQKVLSDAVSNTEDKLDKLREAERQVQEQFKKGEASEEQVRALQREIIATTKKLESYERAVKDTNDVIERLGDSTDEAADDVRDLSDSEKKAEQNADELGGTLGGSLSDGLLTVAGLAAGASAAIVGIVDSTQDYRTAIGKLNTAFETSGHTSEAAKETYKELQSILGDTDQAVEAASHLAELTKDQKDLRKWTKICTGVFAKFGDSLPIEGLTEAANETSKTGELTGSLADALNWAGVNEDDFQKSLDACTTEQERQAKITEVLNDLYADAAEEYQRTNEAIIDANRASEDWNEALADIGEEMQPTVTAIKDMGTELLKSAKEPLEDVANFILEHAIPAITDLGKWVLDNLPVISDLVFTAATAFMAYKTAVGLSKIAQSGLKDAIYQTVAAEKLLQAVQALSPWGWLAVAIGAAATALLLFSDNSDGALDKTSILTEEERELMDTANGVAEAFRDQQAATAENAEDITTHMGHVQSLADELDGLADASGRVQEKDQARVNFILNELNEALGTEYTMTDGVIQKYDELKNNIDSVIQSKTANALLEANNALYVEAIQAENNALQNLSLAEKDYLNQIAVVEQAQKDAAAAREEYSEKANTVSGHEAQAMYMRMTALEAAANREKELLGEKEKVYNNAAADYGNYSKVIMDYEEAQTAALEGNYGRAVDILAKKSGSFDSYANDVDQATREAVDALYKEAIDAGVAAARTKSNFEKGIDGYTSEMVKEAEDGYEAALKEWANAKMDATDVGHDLGAGLANGMETERSFLMDKARSIVNSIISSFRAAADSHSPSRKMIDFGEDMGEGGAIGLEHKTKRMLDVAEEQVDSLLGTYSQAGKISGQGVMRAVQGRDTAQQQANYQAAAGSTAERLDRILAAVERGQVIMLDGDTLVGETVDRIDSKLGQRRALVARGAM